MRIVLSHRMIHPKILIKRPLNAIGLDLVRWRSPDTQRSITFPCTRWLANYDLRTILDIGANEGDFAKTMSERHPTATIYSFEPLAGPFSALQAKTSGVSRCKAFNFALGDADAEVEIHRSAYSPSSSILPMTNLHREAFPISAEDGGTERIQIRRLDDLARELDLKDALLVKVDVQGFEANVIRGGCQTLSRAEVLIVETSFQTLYQGQPLFDDVYQMLKSLGFSYAGNWDQLLDPRTGFVLQADGIFLKAPLNTAVGDFGTV